MFLTLEVGIGEGGSRVAKMKREKVLSVVWLWAGIFVQKK